MTSTKAFRLGLIGHPVSHSKSPEIFQEKFESEGFSNSAYELFDIPQLDHFDQWIEQQANADIPLMGFNVTVPHKTEIIPFLQHISPSAQAIQAVNTVVISRNSSNQQIELHGHNTDVLGFAKSMENILQMIRNRDKHQNHKSPLPTQALILGNGGSAKAVKQALNECNIPHTTLHHGRILETNEPLSTVKIPSHTLIVQTTPVGMWPNIEAFVDFPFYQLNETHAVIDLIYNPVATAFMQKCEDQGAITINGKIMLNAQANAAWELFKTAILNNPS